MATNRRYRYKKWDIVVITWGDALSHYDEKSSEEVLRNDKPLERRTVGFWLGATRWHVILAMENDSAYKDPDADCQTVTKIRHEMVLRTRRLR